MDYFWFACLIGSAAMLARAKGRSAFGWAAVQFTFISLPFYYGSPLLVLLVLACMPKIEGHRKPLVINDEGFEVRKPVLIDAEGKAGTRGWRSADGSWVQEPVKNDYMAPLAAPKLKEPSAIVTRATSKAIAEHEAMEPVDFGRIEVFRRIEQPVISVFERREKRWTSVLTAGAVGAIVAVTVGALVWHYKSERAPEPIPAEPMSPAARHYMADTPNRVYIATPPPASEDALALADPKLQLVPLWKN
jgi:hypothetical protein